MNTSELITVIDAEIDRLTRVRTLLITGASIQTRKGRRKGKRHLSAEGRARISAAMKKRWAQKKRAPKA